MGDLTDITSLYAGTARFFMVDLHAHQHKVVHVDITQPIPSTTNAFVVATQGEIALHHDHEEELELEETIESAVLWVELLNGLTESVRG